MSISISVRRFAAVSGLTLVAASALAACSGNSDDDAGSPVTETVTVTETPSESTTSSAPTETTEPPTEGSSTPADPNDAEIPTEPQAYAQALIDAWLAGDRATAEALVADPDDAEELFDEDDVTGVPEFSRCEGAAGSTYCTWTGTGYEIVIRVGNEAVSLGELGAITDVEVDD